MGLHLLGVYLVGVYLIGLHLLGVHLMSVVCLEAFKFFSLGKCPYTRFGPPTYTAP
jgi:hypothetical protein